MSVSNNQRANQTTFNAAFMDRTADTDSTGRIKTAKWFTDGMADALTAFAGGGQGSALQLATGQNRITVCATDGDSVKLPTAEAGQSIRVINASSKSLAVFPASGAQINGAAINIAYSVPPGLDVVFLSRDLLQWVTVGGSSIAGLVTSSLLNSQGSAANVSGLSFSKDFYTSVRIFAEIRRKTASNEVIATGWISLRWNSITAAWTFSEFWEGDEVGVTIDVTTTAGVAQVTYITDTLAGSGYSGTMKSNAMPVAA